MDDGSKKLGNLTLFLLVIKRLGAFLAMVLLTVLFYFGSNYVPAQFSPIASRALPVLITLDLVFLLFGLLIGRLEYSHYNVIAGEEGITITRGLLSLEEIAIPYRRIKEVRKDRSVTDQMFGSSTLIITVLGEEEGRSEESEITLPSLSNGLAEAIQNKTMNQAEFEKIDVDEPKPSK